MVRISGVGVGKVERIQLVDVGKVLVSVSLPDKIKPRVDATREIVAVGFVGDAAVDFDPGTRRRAAAHEQDHHRHPGGRASPTGRPARATGPTASSWARRRS